MRITRKQAKGAVTCPSVTHGTHPLQVGMGMCPWRVAVASMLLCRTRYVQAAPALRKLLDRWPDAASLARSNTEELMEAVRPCGLHRNRTRQLQRFSVRWLADDWQHLDELPGVGVYVNDSVALFCFGCTELKGNDGVLLKYAENLEVKAQ